MLQNVGLVLGGYSWYSIYRFLLCWDTKGERLQHSVIVDPIVMYSSPSLTLMSSNLQWFAKARKIHQEPKTTQLFKPKQMPLCHS
jgi:hypothetical protein